MTEAEVKSEANPNITRFTDPDIVNLLLSIRVTDQTPVKLQCQGAQFTNCQPLGVLGDHEYQVESLQHLEITLTAKLPEQVDDTPGPQQPKPHKKNREKSTKRKSPSFHPATDSVTEVLPDDFSLADVKVEPVEYPIYAISSEDEEDKSEATCSNDNYLPDRAKFTSPAKRNPRRACTVSSSRSRRQQNSSSSDDDQEYIEYISDSEIKQETPTQPRQFIRRKGLLAAAKAKRRRRGGTINSLREEKYKDLIHQQPDGKWMCKSCKIVKPSPMAIKMHIHYAHISKAGSETVPSAGPKAVASANMIRSINFRSLKFRECEICGHTVKASGVRYLDLLLLTHKATQHGIDSGESHPCSQCSKTFPTVIMLRQHVKGVHKNPKIPCPIEGCTSQVRTSAVRRHITDMHSETEQHICDKCGIKYKSGSALRYHLTKTRAHGAERTVVCDWPDCHKKFFTKKHLKIHYRIHSDEKPFQCDKCGYRARQFTSLNYHNKMHHNAEAEPSMPSSSMVN